MPERDGYIPGVPCWVDTSHRDPKAALPFYSGLFGWEFDDVMPSDASSSYFLALLRGAAVAAVGPLPEAMPQVAMWNTYVAVESADETAARVREAGGRVVIEPFDVMESTGRMAAFADPEGATFCVWQAGEHAGARIVNEHGSLTFNTLHTRDAEGARPFYGSVFGWELLDLGAAGTMWALPGYGDHLEARSPGLREQMAAMGAPERFEDVVASLNPIGGDQPDDAARWSVTFAVDDADEAAAKAAELGGRVVVAPFDAPWVRTTVLADPQGAAFSASQFVPENSEVEAR